MSGTAGSIRGQYLTEELYDYFYRSCANLHNWQQHIKAPLSPYLK